MTAPDPTISEHARARCAEMGISTKVAKAIAKNPTLTYSGNPGTDCRVYLSEAHPEYAVVVGPPPSGSDRPVVVTVLFRTEDDYVRAGATYTAVDSRRRSQF